jgi:hypothetical protein
MHMKTLSAAILIALLFVLAGCPKEEPPTSNGSEPVVEGKLDPPTKTGGESEAPTTELANAGGPTTSEAGPTEGN